MITSLRRRLARGAPTRLPRLLYVALAAAAVLAGCAPKLIPAPVVTVPRFPDFVRPAVPAAFADAVPAINEDRGWRFLQTGDLKSAEHEFELALRTVPEFYPAETGLGYVELAKKDGKAALAHFELPPAAPGRVADSIRAPLRDTCEQRLRGERARQLALRTDAISRYSAHVPHFRS